MKCVNCGKPIHKGQKFCSACGHGLLTCAKCGHHCNVGDLFCDECGQKLGVESVAIPMVPSEAETAKQNLRKHASVLFADIKGSTALIENLDPEEARNLLDPALQEMLNAVYRYDGTIIHTAGDGIVAIFGAPQALEDHAFRACLAALVMQQRIKSRSDKIKIRVGINSGEVLLKVVGSEQHLEYDIAGDVVNLAARMEQTAKPGTIQITAKTLKLVEKNVQVKFIGEITVKGFTDLIQTYELKAVQETRAITKATNKRFLIPFVGRDHELATLQSMLTKISGGHGQAVGICAAAGQGKSRLIYEFSHIDAMKKYSYTTTGSYSHTNNIPMYPMSNLLKRLINLSKQDNAAKIKQKISEHITNINLPYALETLLTLIDIEVDNPDWMQLDAQLKRRYIFDTCKALIFNASLKKPLVLIVEDLHWMDSETESFLTSLIADIDRYHLLLLMSYRPGYSDPWLNHANYINIMLNPLQKANSDELLDLVLGQDVSLQEIRKKLATTCEGNPFFIEEMIKSLISENILLGKPGKYYLSSDKASSDIQLPETIFAVLQTQIDKLPTKKKDVLQISSVIGESFLYSLLEQLSSIKKNELREMINELEQEQYVYEKQLYPEPEYSFKHALIQEVSYKGLLKSQRKLLHLTILNFLETTISTNQIENLQIIAHHAYLSEDWEKALDYCTKAAAQAFLMSAAKLSVQLYERALVAADNLPQTDEVIRKSIDIHIEVFHAFLRLGRFQDLEAHITKAMHAALTEKDKLLESIIYTLYSSYHLAIGKTKKALELAEYANKIALETRSFEAILASRLFLIHSFAFLGDNKKLFALGEIFLPSLPDLEYFPHFFRVPFGHVANSFLFWARAQAADFKYIEAHKDAWFAPVNIKQPSNGALFVTGGLGLCYFAQGRFDEATEYLELGLKYAIEIELTIWIPVYAGALACNYIRLNKPTEARMYLSQALETGQMINYAYLTAPLALGYICEGLLWLGEYHEAKIITEKLLKIATQRNLSGQKAWLLRVRAEIDMNLPECDVDAIKKTLQQALRLALKLEMNTQVAHCHLAFAKFYQMMGEIHLCHEELDVAAAMYQQYDMEYWQHECETLRKMKVWELYLDYFNRFLSSR